MRRETFGNGLGRRCRLTGGRRNVMGQCRELFADDVGIEALKEKLTKLGVKVSQAEGDPEPVKQ